jgi:Uma2 family endonuclease
VTFDILGPLIEEAIMATVSTAQRLVTAEEYLLLAAETDRPTELIRGRMIIMTPPYPWHGFVCSKVDRIVGGFIETNDLGYSVCNDGGVITERDPDTVRGADFAFYSYQRIPKGTFPKKGYTNASPDLAIEVRSPGDTWKEILEKVAEYLKVGVRVVCVLEPERLTATIFEPNQPDVTLEADQELNFPRVLPGFAVQVRRFFE